MSSASLLGVSRYSFPPHLFDHLEALGFPGGAGDTLGDVVQPHLRQPPLVTPDRRTLEERLEYSPPPRRRPDIHRRDVAIPVGVEQWRVWRVDTPHDADGIAGAVGEEHN